MSTDGAWCVRCLRRLRTVLHIRVEPHGLALVAEQDHVVVANADAAEAVFADWAGSGVQHGEDSKGCATEGSIAAADLDRKRGDHVAALKDQSDSR